MSQRWNQRPRKSPLAPVIFALVLLSLCGLLVGPAIARAHALLSRSVPEANSELTQPPATIEMWFTEPLEAGFSKARLLNSLGQEVPTGAVSLDPTDPTHLTLPLGQLQPGIYTVAWQTLSQVDGHEWYGSFPFTVLNPDGSRPSGTAAAVGDGGRGELPTPGEIAARWLVLLGGILFLGAPLFQWLVAPAGRSPRQRNPATLEILSRDLVIKTIWVVMLAIVLGGGLQIVLQTFRLGALSRLPGLLLETRTGSLVLARQVLVFSGLLLVLTLPQPWFLSGRERLLVYLVAVVDALMVLLLLIAGLQGEFTLAVAVIGLAGLVLGITVWLHQRQKDEAVEGPTWRALTILAAALLLSFSVGSHAGAVPGSSWAILGDYVHLIAAAAWLGGLVLLPLLVWQVRRTASPADRRQLLPLVQRFSHLASFAVFVLVITGLFNSLVELPGLTSLWGSAYGRILLLKLFIMALALEVAYFNNRLIHYQENRLQQAAGLRHFNRQVAIEVILSLGLMVSVAILVQTPAPRSFSQPAAAFQPDLPFNTITRADDLYIHLQVTPNQIGNNRFWVHLYHPDNSAIGETQLVRLLFNYREAQLGQARADLQPLGRDTFAIEGAYVNQAGLWDLSVYVRRRGMDDILAPVTLDVPPLTTQPANINPWENPVPALPGGVIVAAALIALGVIPFIWRRPLQVVQPRGFSTLSLIGGILIAGGLVIIIGAGPTLLAQANPGEPVPASPSSIAQGAELFQENCAVCHGVEGLGDGPQAANLEPPPASMPIHIPLHNDRELYGFISAGFPNTAMPAFKDGLTHEEIWHLVNYLRDEFGQSP